MRFDYTAWKAAILVSTEVTLDDLLKASGLIDVDYLEDDIEQLLRDLDELANDLGDDDDGS